MSETPTIALIEWNIGGHHPTYLQHFLDALAADGRPVCVLSHVRPTALPSHACWIEIPSIRWIKQHRWRWLGASRFVYAFRILAALRRAEANLGCRCTKVFFASLYESQAKVVATTASRLALPFAGLYVQASAFHANANRRKRRKLDQWLRHPRLDEIFLLDPSVRAAVEHASQRPTTVLPEVTDTSLPTNNALAHTLGLLPKHRPILGLFGHLNPGKGIPQLIDFARRHPTLEVTFLLAGSCNWDEFSATDAESLQFICRNDPRFILHPHRINAEADYNLLISLCDVIWAVYRHFPHSSNTLAKAAWFRKPILVADGHLMATTTRTYRLGEVVPEEPSQAAPFLDQVLPPLLADPEGWIRRHTPRWDDFHTDHAPHHFGQALQRWKTSPPQPGKATSEIAQTPQIP